jgi:hypothetical protein
LLLGKARLKPRAKGTHRPIFKPKKFAPCGLKLDHMLELEERLAATTVSSGIYEANH